MADDLDDSRTAMVGRKRTREEEENMPVGASAGTRIRSASPVEEDADFAQHRSSSPSHDIHTHTRSDQHGQETDPIVVDMDVDVDVDENAPGNSGGPVNGSGKHNRKPSEVDDPNKSNPGSRARSPATSTISISSQESGEVDEEEDADASLPSTPKTSTPTQTEDLEQQHNMADNGSASDAQKRTMKDIKDMDPQFAKQVEEAKRHVDRLLRPNPPISQSDFSNAPSLLMFVNYEKVVLPPKKRTSLAQRAKAVKTNWITFFCDVLNRCMFTQLSRVCVDDSARGGEPKTLRVLVLLDSDLTGETVSTLVERIQAEAISMRKHGAVEVRPATADDYTERYDGCTGFKAKLFRLRELDLKRLRSQQNTRPETDLKRPRSEYDTLPDTHLKRIRSLQNNPSDPVPDEIWTAEPTRLHIRNIPYIFTDAQLKAAVKGYSVESLSISRKPNAKRNYGYGFIDVSSKAEAERLINEINGTKIGGRSVVVEFAKEKTEAPESLTAPKSLDKDTGMEGVIDTKIPGLGNVAPSHQKAPLPALPVGNVPRTKLSQLTEHERELQIRYFHIGVPLESLTDALVRCLRCHEKGHMEELCPDRTCEHCGMVDHHNSNQCPTYRKCLKCRERGHSKDECPNKLKRTDVKNNRCDTCEQTGHFEENCPNVWRSFKPRSDGPKVPFLNVSCYCCGSGGHWGDDCPMRKRNTVPGSFSAAKAAQFLLNPIQATTNGSEGISIRGQAANVSMADDTDDLVLHARQPVYPTVPSSIHINVGPPHGTNQPWLPPLPTEPAPQSLPPQAPSGNIADNTDRQVRQDPPRTKKPSRAKGRKGAGVDKPNQRTRGKRTRFTKNK